MTGQPTKTNFNNNKFITAFSIKDMLLLLHSYLRKSGDQGD